MRISTKVKPLPARVRADALCFDIDDTFSTDGKITAAAFAALWALKRRGKVLIPVTGRPAGWCDHIARFWPVNGVVGENGAFCMWMENGKLRRIENPNALSAVERREKLKSLRDNIRAAFPGVQWASDQAYRDHDLAIDICEDVPAWPTAQIDALLALCKSKGAQAKLSSVHVNAWFGGFDKASGLKTFFESGPQNVRHLAGDGFPGAVYVGDSPNDEPLFQAFRQSVGVANLKSYLDKISHRPTWLTQKSSGAGFVELSKALLR